MAELEQAPTVRRSRLSASGLLASGLLALLILCYLALVYGTIVVAMLLVSPGIGRDASLMLRAGGIWWASAAVLLAFGLTVVPVGGWLRSRIDDLIYAQHDNPYALLAQLSLEIDRADAAPGALLPHVAATLAATLQLPFVSIEPVGGAPVQHGAAPSGADIVSIPLAYRGTPLGALRVSARRPREQIARADLQLLRDLARQVGITLHAAQLSEVLQESRAQIVRAREEERRRLRRDLHDSLGPALASLRLQLGALRHHVGSAPVAQQLIDELRSDVRSATAEIRRLVYDLRPPMLDELGLLGALRNLPPSDGGPLWTIEAPAQLPQLPAAVEVAAYRIAAEALHNVARHAQATRCQIELVCEEGALLLRVCDDGRGLPAAYVPGVGHQAMQERAAELGGSLTIAPALRGGTCVSVRFPLRADV